MEQTPDGLATLALLKTRFDEGRDHLEFLEPFVADAIHHTDRESFVPAEIADAINERSGLLLPSDTVKTVLGRFARRGHLRREGGRFLDPTLPDPGLEEAREIERSRNARLGEAFSEFAASEGVELEEGQALTVLARFVSYNKVPLVLNEILPDSPLDRVGLDRGTLRLAARFVKQECLESAELSDRLKRLTEGIVLQDALLLRDVGAPPERFRGLTVVLDTPVLLSALNLHGEADGLATREFLTLIREAGATTVAFDRTVNEIRRILALYEERLGTPGGRLGLYPTELTHYVLTNQLGPSDIRVISSTLERRLSQIAIAIRALPDRDRRFTLDEVALAEALADETGDTKRKRITHDVNAIAATLTLRRGRTATTIERCRAVFCTTSGRVIRNAQLWYRQQGERGVPPIVHRYALSSLAWFKRPRAAADIKLHELAALCSAALRPARETWDRFVENLEQLKADGAISDDEAVAVIASELTEPLLARIDDSGEPDADTIRDVIDRVRASYKDEAAAESRSAVTLAETRAAAADRAAVTERSRYLAIEESASRRAQRAGRYAADAVGIVLVVLTVAAAVLAFFDVGSFTSPLWRWLSWSVLVAAGIVGIYSQVHGPSIVAMRDAASDRVAARVRGFLLAEGQLPPIIVGSSDEQSVKPEDLNRVAPPGDEHVG